MSLEITLGECSLCGIYAERVTNGEGRVCWECLSYRRGQRLLPEAPRTRATSRLASIEAKLGHLLSGAGA